MRGECACKYCFEAASAAFDDLEMDVAMLGKRIPVIESFLASDAIGVNICARKILLVRISFMMSLFANCQIAYIAYTDDC